VPRAVTKSGACLSREGDHPAMTKSPAAEEPLHRIGALPIGAESYFEKRLGSDFCISSGGLPVANEITRALPISSTTSWRLVSPGFRH
jgi:hypothetical protein